MCVNKQLCIDNVKMILGILKKRIDPVVKNNLLISLGDFLHRYPNVIIPYTSDIYMNLRDPNQ
jgi:condensin complex subunit 1